MLFSFVVSHINQSQLQYNTTMPNLTTVLLLEAELMDKVLDTFRKYYQGIFHKDIIPDIIKTDITEFSSVGRCYFDVTIDGELIANYSMEVSGGPSIVTIDFLHLNGSIYTKMDVFVEDLAMLALIKYLNKKEMFVEEGIFKFFQTSCLKYKNLKVIKSKFATYGWYITFDVANNHYKLKVSLDFLERYYFQGSYKNLDTDEIEPIHYTSKKKPDDIKGYDDFLELLFKYYTMLQIAQE